MFIQLSTFTDLLIELIEQNFLKQMSKESILNYQVQMIDYNSPGLPKPSVTVNYQFTTWQLNKKIFNIMGDANHTIRWIGNNESSYLNSFIYVLLTISLKNQEFMIKLKQRLYRLSQKYLQKQNQKLLVQFLCMLQYTQDKYVFVRKYPEVTRMIIQILKQQQNLLTNKQNFKTSIFTLDSPIKIQRKYSFDLFCSIFNFISVSHPKQYAYKFKCQSQCLYLIVEKDCFFVVEKQQDIIYKKQKENSVNKLHDIFKNSTPRFHGCANSATKHKSQRKNQHLVHQTKHSQNFLDISNNHQSQDCSIQDIKQTLKIINNEIKPQKKLLFDQIKTQKYLPYARKENSKGTQKRIGTLKEQQMIKKIRKSQQKRQQLWLKLEQEYYQKKRQIRQKIKQNKINKNHISVSKLSRSKHEQASSQKQRKKSFNSFTGFSMRDYNDSEFYESQFDNHTIKSHNLSDSHDNSLIKLKKIRQKRKPSEIIKRLNHLKQVKQHGEAFQSRKKTSNQNIITQENRLSVIQEQNRLKFLTFLDKSNQNQSKSPKIATKHSSTRQTLQPNISVTFNYASKESQNSHHFTPNVQFQKTNYWGSPIRV